LLWIIAFTALGGIASATFAGLYLLLPERTGIRLLPHFVSFATGALLGAALLALLPEAIEGVGVGAAHTIGAALLLGLGIFFVIEKLVLWRHGAGHDPLVHEHANAPGAAAESDCTHPHHELAGHHHPEPPVPVREPVSAPLQPGHDHHGHDHHGHVYHGHDHHGHSHHGHQGAAGVLLLIGDSIHNVLDGVLIAAAFLSNIPLGLVTTLAVAAHEIPHRVGDFAILLHTGMSRRRALVLNMATGLGSVLGGIVAYAGLQQATAALPYALALAAAGFLYIAVAGLIPALHRRADARTSLAQVLLMGLGVGVVAWAEALAH
ncbi:MAG: ZIP family metal transporter, partial [Sinobacteraceae bacterium]|nr:ZIP family metal transporter [Nevskiaceae bacterium]